MTPIPKLVRVRVITSSSDEDIITINSFWPEEVARIWSEPGGVFLELKNNFSMKLDHSHIEIEELINQSRLGIRSCVELNDKDGIE